MSIVGILRGEGYPYDVFRREGKPGKRKRARPAVAGAKAPMFRNLNIAGDDLARSMLIDGRKLRWRQGVPQQAARAAESRPASNGLPTMQITMPRGCFIRTAT